MKRLVTAGALALLAACSTSNPRQTATMLDLKITNGRILDGTGAPWFRADLGVRGDRIVAIGNLGNVTAAQTIDAQDRIVAPGFIDLLGQSQISVLADPHVEAKIRQGVTTEVTGEGYSPGPALMKAGATPGPSNGWPTLGAFLDELERKRSAVNFALFVGSSNPRSIVIGDVDREPTLAEMRQMEQIVDQAMRDGAIGLSTSLIYLPAMYSKTEEIINLARVAAKYDGVYFSHIRNEGDAIDAALDEAFLIGREAHIPVNIWHLKIGGVKNWGRMPDVIARIQRARDEGIDAAANVYPYIASGTALSTLAPDWAMEGGYSQFRKRLADPESRTKIFDEFRHQFTRRGPRSIYVARIANPAQKQYERKFLDEIAPMMNLPQEEALATLFEQNESSPHVMFFSMNEDDLRYALKQPFVSVGADSGSPTAAARASGEAVHPRAYGSFARVIGFYSRDEKLFPLEEAVRKMTSLAAMRANIHDRGVLREGMKADVIIFDSGKVRDVARYEDPHHFSEGFSDVVVNGVPVLRDGQMTDALPGQVIRGKGYVKR